jgi:hypothetical protein
VIRSNREAGDVQAGDEITLRGAHAATLGWLRVGGIKPHYTTRNARGMLLWSVQRVTTGERFDLVIHEGEIVDCNRKERVTT